MQQISMNSFDLPPQYVSLIPAEIEGKEKGILKFVDI